MRPIEQSTIVIAGAARSGVAVAELLSRQSAKVLVTDRFTIAPDFRKRLELGRIPFEEGGHSSEAMEGDFLVLSPGVPSDSSIVKEYLRRGKPVYSEIEVASWFCRSRIIAVTGSNGKTTVVNWLADVWKRAGRPFLLAGNVGVAFSEIVEKTSPETDVILEVSSFQLDHVERFRARVAIILNITPDHLNRYEYRFEQYIASKMQLPRRQYREDVLIYGYDDPVVRKQVEAISGTEQCPALLPFSSELVVPGAYIRDGVICVESDSPNEEYVPMNEISLPGKHNVRNGLAVTLAARICEIEKEPIRDSLTRFEGVAHRLQKVREFNGVAFYNDSKATNVNAVWYALTSFTRPVVLIMGGRDKGNDYGELIPEIRKKVKAIIALGESRQAVRDQLDGEVSLLLFAETMHEAVQTAYAQSVRGDVVLLSPACASFDMFESFEDRGYKFIQSVMAL